MDFVYIIAGVVLTVLFFLNIKSAADILCRITGGFAILMIYNALSSFIPIISAGVNIISSTLVGFMGLPGMILIILCGKFF